MLFICFCYFSVLFLFSLFFPFLFSYHNFDQSDRSKKFRRKKNVWKFFIELFRLIYLNFSGNYPNLLNKNFWEMKKKKQIKMKKIFWKFIRYFRAFLTKISGKIPKNLIKKKQKNFDEKRKRKNSKTNNIFYFSYFCVINDSNFQF